MRTTTSLTARTRRWLGLASVTAAAAVAVVMPASSAQAADVGVGLHER
jgi:hypothetical protein